MMKGAAMSMFEYAANQFAAKFNLTMSAHFMGHDHHWHGDDNTRDRWKIRLIREGRVMEIEFGNSVAESCFCPASEGMYWVKNRSNNGISRPKPPSMYSVIACITKHEVGTFRSWCNEMGENEDSRNALDTYLRVQNEYEDWCRLCNGNVMLEESREIQ